MKKTLAALAVLGAFAGTAAAADVTLYGVVDTGLAYTYDDMTDEPKEETFGMMSGYNAVWDEGGKNGLANSGGLRHDTTSFKESFHGHAPPPVHS